MKKARVLLIATLLSFVSVIGYSQGRLANESPECLRSLSFYNDYMKQNNLKEAAPLWREAFKHCTPGVRQGIYVDGIRIFRNLIDNTSNNDLKNSYIDSLLMMYNLRLEHFPSNAAAAAEFKVYDLVQLRPDSDKEIMDAILEAMKYAGNEVSPAILVLAMQKALDLNKSGHYTVDQVVEKYSLVSEVVEKLVSANNGDAEQAKTDIDNLFASSGLASCENIIKLFTPRFRENPNDRDLVATIVKLLNDADCTEDQLYIETVQALYNMDPSNHTYARYLHRLYSNRGEHENALKMLQSAIDSDQSTDEEKANMYIEMSNYYLQRLENLPKAAESARLAIQRSSTVAGRGNLILGLIWGSLKCNGGNDVESRAKYWVAVDYLTRARAADSSIADEANRYIQLYSQYFPAQEEAFMYDIIDGQNFTVSCGGMREVTKVRTRK